MSEYRVVEKFVSINGEGRCAGELACFIRFAGCNLNCSYCDTKWANEKDVKFTLMSKEDIYKYIKSTGAANVTLTGGEPLIQENIHELIEYLASDNKLSVELETNGAVSLAEFVDIPGNVTFTMDYKLPGSGMEKAMRLDNMEILRECDTVKFVISDKKDMLKADEIVKRYKLDDRLKVYFSSAFGEVQPKDIVEFMIERKLSKVRLQLQMHKYIWAPDKKGV